MPLVRCGLIEEPREPSQWFRVADIIGERRLVLDGASCYSNQAFRASTSGSRLPEGTVLQPDRLLDGIEGGDACKRLAGD